VIHDVGDGRLGLTGIHNFIICGLIAVSYLSSLLIVHATLAKTAVLFHRGFCLLLFSLPSILYRYQYIAVSSEWIMICLKQCRGSIWYESHHSYGYLRYYKSIIRF